MVNNIKMRGITRNPFLLFAPFLLIYIILVLVFPTTGIVGDEGKYLVFAKSLAHGYYSSPLTHVNLGEGPGYPLILVPFVAAGLPLITITLFNAVLYYFSIVLLYKTLEHIVSRPLTFLVSLFWACYFNSYETIPLTLTETLASFLIILVLYCSVKAFSAATAKPNKYLYFGGFFIGYLAMTKLIFGYVLLLLLVASVVLWIFNRKALNYKKALLMMAIAFATTVPYLAYTHQMTGRFFYWGTAGGNNLYWMSTPNPGEYGDWFPDLRNRNEPYEWMDSTAQSKAKTGFSPLNGFNYFTGSSDSLKLHHQDDFDQINKYVGAARDDEYKRIAIRNIKANPGKFLRNCISNAGRIVFNFPYSYTIQKPGTLVRIPFNGSIVLFSVLCMIPMLLHWRRIAFSIRLIFFIAIIYLGGSLFGSAETRMFTVIVPLLIAWIAYILDRSVRINWRFNDSSRKDT